MEHTTLVQEVIKIRLRGYRWGRSKLCKTGFPERFSRDWPGLSQPKFQFPPLSSEDVPPPPRHGCCLLHPCRCAIRCSSPLGGCPALCPHPRGVACVGALEGGQATASLVSKECESAHLRCNARNFVRGDSSFLYFWPSSFRF